MRIILFSILLLFTLTVSANMVCGFKPIKPIGCSYLVCIDGKWRCVSESRP